MQNTPLAHAPSGWGQYFTASLSLVVTGLTCGTVATVATIYGSPFVAVAFAATGAIALNSFVIKGINEVKQENRKTKEKLEKKFSEHAIETFHRELVRPERASRLANIGIGSGVVGILSAASSAVFGSAQASLQDQSDNNLRNSGAALTAGIGGTAILVGFTALTVLGNRAGKLKNKLIEPGSLAVASTTASSAELSTTDHNSRTTTKA